jgi:tetratricopeptide (TPR) repeat protein
MDGSRQPFRLPLTPCTMVSQMAQFEQDLADIAMTGSNDAQVLETRRRLGFAYAVAGRAHEAINELDANLAAAEAAWYPEHVDVIGARGDLAWAWRRDGQVQQALTIHEKCVADLGKHVGPDSALLATARVDLGRTLLAARRHDLAIRQLEQALAAFAANRGSECPDALAGRVALASAYRAVGRVEEAVELGQRAVEDCILRLRPDDPEAISCRALVASIYGATGRPADAVAMLSEAQADFQRVLGPDHVETIRTGLALALNFQRSGSIDQAVAEFEQSLETATRVLGRQHPLAVNGRDGLAATYLSAGRMTKAVAVFEEVVADTRPPYDGDGNYDRRRAALAFALFGAGRSVDAITLLETTIAECKGTGDPAGRTAVDAQLVLADLYAKVGRDGDADSAYRAALHDVERVYGPDHEKSRKVRQRLSRAKRSRLLHRRRP